MSSAGNVLWPLADHPGTIRDIADYDEGDPDFAITNHRVYDRFGRWCQCALRIDPPWDDKGADVFMVGWLSSLDVNDRASKEQAVQRGAGHHGVVGEDVSPLAKRLVAGQADRLIPLAALAHRFQVEVRSFAQGGG